jgi:hypothetical protein
MRLAHGILVVILATKACTLATAQVVEQSSKASFPQGDPTIPGGFLSAPKTENGNHYRTGDRLPRWLNENAHSNLTALPSDEQPSTASSITNSQDGAFDECCRPINNACPCFYVQVDALFLQWVPRLANQPIVVDPNTDITYLSTSNLGFNFDPGLQATFGMRLCGGRALEFSYFGLFQGTASAVVVQPDADAFLTFPDNLVGNVFVNMDRVQVDYSASLNSFEINLPCCCGCCDECPNECGCGQVNCHSWEWFAGFRYLNVGEQFNILAQRTVDGEVEEGTYNIRTNNNLYGAQLGARWRRMRGRFGWEAGGRAGVFGNDAQQRQSVTDFPNFPLRPSVSSSRGAAAFVGQGNLTALYRITDVWNVRAGYTVLWIEGLALAPDQLDFDFAAAQGGTQLHDGGGLFLHGVNVGLEARW